MNFDLRGLLQQYVGGLGSVQSSENVSNDFQKAAQSVPHDVVKEGLSETFRSEQTPPFANIVSQLFSQATPRQQADMLNQLLNGLSSEALGLLAQRGVLAPFLEHGGERPTVSPEQTDRVTPEQIREIATHAEQHNPSIVERMSDFYADHPALVKTLGGAALSVALAKMAERMRT